MRYENGKVYASRKVARFWRPILQPIVNRLHRIFQAVVELIDAAWPAIIGLLLIWWIWTDLS